MRKAEIRSRILYLAEEVADVIDAEVVDVDYTGPERHSVVRIFVDKIGGIGLDECARISRNLADLLDMEDLIPHRYRLEVSSPGVDRPLKKPRDFARFKGELVKIITTESIEGEKVHMGRLHDFENNRIYMLIGNNIREIPLSQIDKANLQFEFPFGKDKKNLNK